METPEKKVAFTPGPWFVVEYAGWHTIQATKFYSHNGDLLNEDDHENAAANAQLAATSPELYDTLKAIVDMNGVGYKDPALFVEHLQPLIQEAMVLLSKAPTL